MAGIYFSTRYEVRCDVRRCDSLREPHQKEEKIVCPTMFLLIREESMS